MDDKTTLKEKCEALRSKTDYRVDNKGYLIMMFDGHNFSKMVKKRYKLPFDGRFIEIMNETAKYLCKNVQGCKMAYTQSDEISLVCTCENEGSTFPFGGRLCKIQSNIAGMATKVFNYFYLKDLVESGKSISEGLSHLVEFDCKAWTVDTFNDVFCHFLWRQNDCIRNSKQQAAQAYLPHKQLLGKTTDEQVAMLLEKKSIDWNTEYCDGKKYGRFIRKDMVKILNEEYNADVERSVWNVVLAQPLNSENGKEILMNLGVPELK